jgi:ATP-binding cassette subfamily C (CFTR/MRP) protein 1
MLVGLQAALLVLWSVQHGIARNISITATGLGLLSSIGLSTLSYLEHRRSIRPSTTLSLYLMLAILFNAIQCRTLWLISHNRSLNIVFSLMLATEVVVFVLESQSKKHLLYSTYQDLGAEATSGIVSRWLYIWINGLMLRGSRGKLTPSTLEETDDQLKSKKMLYDMRQAFGRERSRPGWHRLLFSLLRVHWSALVDAAVARLVVLAFDLVQPFLLERVILYVGGDRGQYPKSFGYGLIGATALIYLGTGVRNPTCSLSNDQLSFVLETCSYFILRYRRAFKDI